MILNIVLINPEIPQNTGNIIRTCGVTGAILHLIKPLGFSMTEKALRRAGLDYHKLIDIQIHESFEEFYNKNSHHPFYFFSTRGEKSFYDVKFEKNSYLCFGPESEGFKDEFLNEKNNILKIPMIKNKAARSLNLSNSVAIVIYVVLRQNNFE